ncbi:MAG TPA: tRNA preQ1(34) S-adenosylmethionine ribosyltransferase-isomerase QueA [Kiritimatiellia bacterium]|nr:tRNA preQ1(34) S-adenosylmethionine ribosyltransferase-isomerase QueA [Kiritimatiellia bacterium]
MNTSDFDYFLPPELIAQQPVDRRDESRMMVMHRADRRWEHRRVSDLPAYLRPNDLLVLNNTRVIPARLFARKPGTGGRAEVFLLEALEEGVWEVLLRCRRRPEPGGRLELEGGGAAEILAYGEQGAASVRFHIDRPLLDYLEEHGHTPLPPYIKRVTGDRCPVTSGESEPVTGHRSPVTDKERYQTIYARTPGAVAAPTAGLHFTPELFERLAAAGVGRAELTLHVGIGTFRPVSVERVEDHVMHDERYEVPTETAAAVRAARANGGRVVAVGTTSVRTLEAVAARHGAVVADQGRTSIFIYPPYTFRAVDALLTNFHLPQSTLLMMISAFAAREFILAAYAEAVREKYRFFSYGDCMLIL